MTDNSDTEKPSTSPEAVARKRHFLAWAGGIHKQDFLFWIAGAMVIVLFVLILWKVPQWQVAQVQGLKPAERFDRENEARKTLAQILAGIVVLAGGYATLRNLRLAQESLKVSQESSATSQKALMVSQEGQITDRFTKAIEQLGAVDASGKKKLEVRLGGIYALERIANESETDHWPIVEVLCTYVREHAPVTQKESDHGKQASNERPHLGADIQAILTVLGRRDRKYEKESQYLNLAETDLNSAALNKADLRGALLSSTDLSRAFLYEADLSGAFLDGAKLSGALLDGAKLSGALLDGAELSGAYLSRSDLSNAGLRHAKLDGATLINADVSGADLGESDLSRAVLDGAKLIEAFLSETNLGGASLGAEFSGRADLSGATLSEAVNLTQDQIDTAIGDRYTKLPANLHMPESWKE